MAGFGPPPAETKRRRNKDTFEEHAVEVDADEVGKAPRLPNASKLNPATRRWWKAWTENPVTSAWLSTDWERLLTIVPLVEAYWQADNPNAMTKLMAEIRQNESLLGATHVDRMRARIKVSDDKASTPRTTPAATLDNVTPIGSRRERLLGNA